MREYFVQTIRTWNDARYINIALLGIRVSVDDVSILGTPALFLTSYWLLLCCRRENQTIAYLLQATNSKEETAYMRLPEEPVTTHKMVKWYIFHTIIANLLFDNVSKCDQPIDKSEKAALVAGAKAKDILLKLRRFIYLYPIYVSIICFAMEIWSTRNSSTAHLRILSRFSGTRRLPISSRSCAMLMILLLSSSLRKSLKYARATETIIDRYRKYTSGSQK